MALICMAVHDTEENQRSEMTKKTVESLMAGINWQRHRVIIIDNGSCASTKEYLKQRAAQTTQTVAHTEKTTEGYTMVTDATIKPITVFTNAANLGTAAAINQGLQHRKSGEYVIKMDNDVVIHKTGWVDEMEDVMRRMPQIGILGLKRVDLGESTYSINTDMRSKLLEVPHESGQRWRVVEECKHVMGTCTMLNPALLDRIGYFYQMDGLYGFDDSLLCIRSNVAGFMNCFLHGIDIDHIDPGGTEYADWKQKYAGAMLTRYAETEHAFKIGLKDIYYNPYNMPA